MKPFNIIKLPDSSDIWEYGSGCGTGYGCNNGYNIGNFWTTWFRHGDGYGGYGNGNGNGDGSGEGGYRNGHGHGMYPKALL